MNDFIKRLTAIRKGASGIAKKGGQAIGRGVDSVIEKQKAVGDAREARDRKAMLENFGSEENYRKTIGLDTPEGQELFTTPYAKAGQMAGKAVKGVKGMFDRLVSLRGGGK